ncbi:MAG: helix-turn-helix domain-containing protein [Actinomycetota bacterium]
MTDVDANEAVRGPQAVRRSLIDAAVQLMAMRSPRQISGRELAKHAGVNYGLIHHYFGSKDAVFAEAVSVATEEMGERWDTDGILPVNTTDDAASYRTFAKLELDDARSPMTDLMHRIVRGQASATGRAEDDPDLLAQVALCAALQFGWGAFEEEIVTGLQDFGVERDTLRERVSELSMRLGDG